MTGTILIVAVVGLILGFIVFFVSEDRLHGGWQGFFTLIGLLTMAFALTAGLAILPMALLGYSGYISDLNEYRIIDKKIELVDQNSRTLIEESKKVLLEYPELEKSLLTDLKPETMIALGQTYPTLKSNESYNQIATLLKERLLDKEYLQKQKLDIEIRLNTTKDWWWFASNWREEAKK